jgi:uncharacterized protein YdgA (DUF945 family)
VKKPLVLVAAVAVLVAALAALPYWFGTQVESAYEAMIANTTQSGDLTVTQSKFERGWLESTADTTLAVIGTPVTISVLHRISHGPLPLDDGFQFQPVLARVKSQASIVLPAGLPKLQSINGNTTVYLAGNSQTTLDMPPTKATAADGTAIDWRGLTGSFETSADFKSTKGSLTAPLLNVTGGDGKGVSLSKLRVTVDQQKGASGFDVGTLGVALDKLSVDAAAGSTAIDGLNVTTTTRESAGSLESGASFHFKEVATGDSRQGPGQINIQIRKLDIPTLTKFRTEVQALRKQKMPQEQVNMMVLGKTLELLGNLAKKSPELEITKLSFKTADGEVTGKAKFVLDGSQLDVSGNPMLMLRALSGEGELSLPDALVRLLAREDVKRDIEALKKSGKLKKHEIAKLTPKRIEMITQEALKQLPQYRDSVVTRLKLVPDGPNYKVVGVLKNGQIMVNNEPIALP